jgi:hypothetical protein
VAAEVTALGAAFASVERTERRDLSPRIAAVAGGVLLVALAAGAVVAPSAPPPLSPRLRVHEYFVANHDAALNQSFFVHGVAGIALVVLVVALWRAGVHRRLFVAAGLAAAVASLVQLFLVFRIEQHIESGVGVRQTDALFDALNQAGALKFAFLAVAVLAVSSLVSAVWVKRAGYAVAPFLALAAVALLTRGPGLRVVLLLSLPVLMVWLASASTAVYRQT